jgi:dipeptide transport system ATP-binding protein
MTVVVQAAGAARHYRVRRGLFAAPATVQALDGVSFDVHSGRTSPSWANRAAARARWRGC